MQALWQGLRQGLPAAEARRAPEATRRSGQRKGATGIRCAHFSRGEQVGFGEPATSATEGHEHSQRTCDMCESSQSVHTSTTELN